MIVPSQGQLVAGRDGIYVPSKSTGHATTLPMDEADLERAREREKTKTIGFAPPEPETPVVGLA